MLSLTLDRLVGKLQNEGKVSVKFPTLIVFLSNLPIAFIGIFITRKYLVENGVAENLSHSGIQSIFGVSAVIMAIVTLISWGVFVGINYMALKLIMKENININFRKFWSIWAIAYPVKVTIITLASILLLSLMDGYNISKEFAVKWQIAQGRISIIASVVYLSVIYVIMKKIGINNSSKRLIIALFLPYTIWTLITQVAKVSVK